jgi:hypothetical protein
MIEINDDEIYDIDLIHITTRCGEADLNKNLKWKSGNKELQKYLNKKFNSEHPELSLGHGRFEIAVFILADLASHHLGGEMIAYHLRKPLPDEPYDPNRLD